MKNTKEEKAVILGKALFIDFDAFVEWTKTEEADEFFSVPNLWTGVLYELQGKIPGVNVSHLFDMTKISYFGGNAFDEKLKNYIEPLTKYQEYIRDFSSDETPLSFDLLYEHEKFDIISFGNKQFLIPAGNICKTLWTDYSDVPLNMLKGEIKKALSCELSDSLVPSGTALSASSLSSQRETIEKKKIELNIVAEEIDDVENARTGELAELQAEIDRQMKELQAKKDAMLTELNKKKAEMEAVKEKMEKELFVLESEIYSIRCFLGEVVDFIKIRSGNLAPDDCPIFLHQKMRFLDEELGKMIAFYDFDFSETKIFEKLLKEKSDAVNVFCPNDKCVSLVRVSRTGKTFGYMDTPYGSMLAEYEVYHGQKIGILVRNGENLYLGWTDEEKINIPEDMFFTPSVKTVGEEDAKIAKETPIKEMVSRYFIFSILQGLLSNRKILTLPDGVQASFTKPSSYIVYTAADAWLTDNRYGTFADIMKKVNSRVNAGDPILSLMSLSDWHWEQGWGRRAQFFERDRNNSRRTGDVHLSDGHIYSINLVEDDEYGDKALYVSLEKYSGDYVYRNGDYYKRQRESRANFRVYEDEFLNLTYMNSVWLQYVITTRNLGGSGRMNNYAEVIRYLNKALDFVRKREMEEEALIKQYYLSLSHISDWPVLLSEWKLENGVRNITEYQAKRFAKILKEKSEK